MPVTENPLFPRFNDSSVPDSAHSLGWDFNLRATSSGSDARQERQSRPYFASDISNLLLNDEQLNYFMWLNAWARGNVRTVGMRVSIFCELGDTIGRNSNGAPLIRPAFFVVGVGGEQQAQITKTLSGGPGFSGQDFLIEITKPHIDYPDMKNISGEVWRPMPQVQLYTMAALNVFNLLSRDYWECDRDTGIITFDYADDIYISGGFYIPMIMPARVPITRDKESKMLYRIGSAKLEEPPSDVIDGLG